MAGLGYFEISSYDRSYDEGMVENVVKGALKGVNPLTWITKKGRQNSECIYLSVRLANEREYVNLSGDWRINARYVEHPILTGCYIEETEYRDYLLREMVRDIADFIMAYFPLKEITVGLVEESYSSTGLSLSVKELNPSAKLSCYVSSSYLLHLNDTQQGDIERELEYNIWIEKFPDIVSAVTHGTKSMEVIKETQVATDVSAAVATAFSAAFAQNNSVKFYVKYERK